MIEQCVVTPDIKNILDCFLKNINVIYKSGFLEWFRKEKEDVYRDWLKNETKIETIIKEIDCGFATIDELTVFLEKCFLFFKTELDLFKQGAP